MLSCFSCIRNSKSKKGAKWRIDIGKQEERVQMGRGPGEGEGKGIKENGKKKWAGEEGLKEGEGMGNKE